MDRGAARRVPVHPSRELRGQVMLREAEVGVVEAETEDIAQRVAQLQRAGVREYLQPRLQRRQPEHIRHGALQHTPHDGVAWAVGEHELLHRVLPEARDCLVLVAEDFAQRPVEDCVGIRVDAALAPHEEVAPQVAPHRAARRLGERLAEAREEAAAPPHVLAHGRVAVVDILVLGVARLPRRHRTTEAWWQVRQLALVALVD
mmetsp:Transcript_43815/g.142173  ORF Transcript_43815/g.142173 Transcript_43815/m.142173 type:complete len:203 (-) Transcript_43815:1270-1878(-)